MYGRVVSTLSLAAAALRMGPFRGRVGRLSRAGAVQIQVNGEQHEVQDAATVAQLLADLGLASRHVAVELNLKIVPRTAHDETTLSSGDALEIVTLVGGG